MAHAARRDTGNSFHALSEKKGSDLTVFLRTDFRGQTFGPLDRLYEAVVRRPTGPNLPHTELDARRERQRTARRTRADEPDELSRLLQLDRAIAPAATGKPRAPDLAVSPRLLLGERGRQVPPISAEFHRSLADLS